MYDQSLTASVTEETARLGLYVNTMFAPVPGPMSPSSKLLKLRQFTVDYLPAPSAGRSPTGETTTACAAVTAPTNCN